MNWIKKHPVITIVFIIFFLIIIGNGSSLDNKNVENKKIEKIKTTANSKQNSTTTIITISPNITKNPTKQILQKKEEIFLNHSELLKLKEKVLGKNYKMILYLEQMPLNTDADFITLADKNDLNNILIRCYMNKYDLEDLDGKAAQKGILKSYKLNVNFKKFNRELNIYEASCNLLYD